MNKILLNANEYPYNFGDKELLKRLIADFDFNRYPDKEYLEIRKKLSKINKCKKDEIVVTNGSDELIQLIMIVFSKEEDTIVSLEPTFSEYRLIANSLKRRYVGIAPIEGVKLNTEKLLDVITNINPEVIFLCSPNNPTGEVLDKEFVVKVLNSTKKLVVLDEAYVEFSKTTLKDLTYDFENLIIMRTLSKAYGLASLRIGYGIANKSIIDKLNNLRMPYNVSALSAYLANRLLDEIDVEENVNYILREKSRILKKLDELGIEYIKSYSNFILLNSQLNQKIFKKALEKNIILRKFDSEYLKDYIRFSIGQSKENDELVSIFSEVIADERS